MVGLTRTTGANDLIFPHHENEIAQSEGATGKPFVKYWLHGEFLIIDKGKMAKSGEGFVTLDSVKKEGIAPLAYPSCFRGTVLGRRRRVSRT